MTNQLTFAVLAVGLGALLSAQKTAGEVGQEKATAKQDRASKSIADAKLQSIGPIAFAEGNALLVSDPMATAIYAFDVADQLGDGLASDTKIEKIDAKIAALLGTEAGQVQVIDLVVHPSTRQAYIAVMRGRGNDAKPVIVRVDAKGKLATVSLAGRKFGMAKLDADVAQPKDATAGGNRSGRSRRGGNRGNQRMESITDVAWVKGKVVVAGLSNEEFASKLRVLDYPFKDATGGASVEIYHGAHGAFETRSPVRTFVGYEIAGKPHIVAAYTCTPLVTIPMSDLQPGKKVQGKTVAELGNRNRPLDIIVYEDDDKDYLLMSNSARGVMKVPTAGIEKQDAITSRVRGGGTAGLKYETIKGMDGVLQLDKLDAKHALVIVQAEGGLTLQAVRLP